MAKGEGGEWKLSSLFRNLHKNAISASDKYTKRCGEGERETNGRQARGTGRQQTTTTADVLS